MVGIKDYRVEGEGDRVFYLLVNSKPFLSFNKKENTLVTIEVSDWNSYLSPWKMENPFKGGEDFGGLADVLIGEMESRLIPEVEKERRVRERYIVGYSLSGLFSLYFSTKRGLFNGVGSVSSSLWFKDFGTYLSSHKPMTERVYLSVGKKEKNIRNDVMSKVEEKTREAEKIIRGSGVETFFLLEEGGHFGREVERLERCIKYFS